MSNWSKFFKERPLTPVILTDMDFYSQNPFECLHSFYAHEWGTLLTLGTIVFPRLVRLFYANVKFDKGKGNLSFMSTIKGKNIVIDESTLGDLLDVSPPKKFINNDFTTAFANEARHQFTTKGHSTAT